jgi:hypothetical protein
MKERSKWKVIHQLKPTRQTRPDKTDPAAIKKNHLPKAVCMTLIILINGEKAKQDKSNSIGIKLGDE